MLNKSHLTDETIAEYLREMGIKTEDVEEVSIDNDYKLVVKFAVKRKKDEVKKRPLKQPKEQPPPEEPKDIGGSGNERVRL